MTDGKGMIELTGLWKEVAKSGETYYVGVVGGVKYLVFKNKGHEKNKNAPHLRLCIAQVERKQDTRGRAQGQAKDPFDSEIPFKE